ncbi:hypothetical protein M378DRAFT_166083 [Amanita muscaria Koide BX008]|uniref:Peptide hydrolase n=1 Tax=Amanita muscaria (strain Koide BX008) TaxID=946122 RepID=A0A0C2WZ10_AMAMK|nr:hypothetical protein M378DRAFT_166083 [Amanita muscaria Koide BX008]
MAPGVGSYRQGHWGPLKSLLALSPILIAVPLLAVWQHNDLPTPLTELVDPRTNLPQISEARILDIARYLSEDIGYRTVGTYEHALADGWLHGQVLEFQKECQKAAEAAAGMGVGGSGGRKLECEVWRQQGSGSHRFDMMGKRVYKTYVNLTNIIVRISNGTPKGKQNAILVNAHLDSTLPSPGAADDALCVGVMMDVMRVLVGTPGWSPEHAIIFLFNNAEESLQDGSHLYSTQHPTAPTVRTVINLEAAGTSGRELLFQATSEQMVQAYAHVPRPYGTILANDIFRSGFILSDTDFRQFEYYLNVTGLDMAFIGNSYLYHMRKDTVENIGKGAGQHMGENVLALVKYLSSIVSPLPTLAEGYTPPSTVFFSHIRSFVLFSFTTAKIMYSSLFVASLIMIRLQKNGQGLWKEQLRGVLAVMSAHVGGVVVPNIVALVMTKVLGKGMSWFSNEYSAIALYGFPMLLGVLFSQYIFGPVPEHTILTSLLLVDSASAFVLQSVGIGSAVFFFILALPLFVALSLNPIFAWGKGRISLMTYAIGYPLPMLTTMMLMLPVTEFFVPLTGRIGAEVPADNIIATIVSVLGLKTVSFALPFAHRFGRKSLGRAVALFSVFTILVMAIFAMRAPFDAMHQKRLFFIHSKNITSQERCLHISGADSAPGLEDIVNEVSHKFVKSEKPALIEMSDDNPDWASLYPFSSFLTAYKILLPSSSQDVSSWTDKFIVTAENDIRHVENGTRSLTIKVYHPGLIWTVIAFDAHVLKWSLDDFPPDEYARHHIREASFYQIDTWTVDLVIDTTSNPRGGGLRIDFVGIEEEGMWPGKQGVAAENRGEALMLFENLDGWLDDRLGGTADALLMGTVAGVANI